MFTLEKSKELCKDHRTMKVVENINKLKTRSKEKGFKNLLPQHERKLKLVIVNQPLLTSPQIFVSA